MRHLLLLLILPFLSAAQEAPIQERKLTTEVSAVTVYFSGALIGRKTDVQLKAGKHRLIFTGLEADLVERSLQVDAPGLQINSVSVRSNFMDATKREGEVGRLQSRIDSLKAALEDVHDQMQVLAKQEELLSSNRELGGEEQGVKVTELREAVALYESKYAQLKTDLRKHSRKTQELRRRLQQTMEQQQEISGTVPPKTSEVTVEASCERDLKAVIELRYMTPLAGWTPVYDIRAEGVGKPLTITLKANVRQSTGIAWKDVSLGLTTENPFESGQLPELKRWDFPGGRKRTASEVKHTGAKGFGSIVGTVKEAHSGETVPFANVILFEDGNQVTGTTTDLDGKYRLTNVPSGSNYSVRVSSVGYQSKELVGVKINNAQLTFVDFQLDLGVRLSEVVVTNYSVPLIQRDGGSIEKMPSRGANAAITSVAGAISSTGFETAHERMAKRAAEERQKAEADAQKLRQQVERTSSSDVRTEMEKQLTRVNYKVATPFSVPSDDKDYTVIIDQFKVSADMSYSAAPIDIPYAFLIARTTGWEDFIKLDGKASIYVSGTYIGEALLTPSTTEDTMTVSLGTDRDIVIERNLMKDFRRSQTVGSRTIQQRGYEIKVRNTKPEPAKLTLQDQIPVSTTKEVEVRTVELSGAKLDEEKGILNWQLDLAPNESRTIILKYEVRHPQYQRVTLE